MKHYLDLPILEIHQLLKEKKITPVDLVKEAYFRIEQSNTNAFISTAYDASIKEAEQLENMEIDNPLFGIPIALKDNIVTKAFKTTCASKMLEDFVSLYDATVVSKLKEKHMIIIGKTNMDEFAMGSTTETSYFGNTLNPWNHERVPGGSSGGSAAAVAERLVPLALGTDTGGSIRQPSSFCGTVGLKPTYGRVSRYGLVAFASSLDQIGPMSKNVMDNALLLNAICGQDQQDFTSFDTTEDFTRLIGTEIKNLKIGIPNYYMSEVISPEIRASISKIIDVIKQQGCQVDYIDIDYLEYAIPLYQVIALGEASSNLARYDGIKYGYTVDKSESMEDFYKKVRTDGFGEEVKRRLMIGSYVLSGKNADRYYKKALCLRGAMTKSFQKQFETYDLLIGPTNTGTAYSFGTHQDDALKSFYDDLLTIPVNMAGLPAMSMPIGLDGEGMPIGIHLIGKPCGEATIYQLASFLEKTIDLDLNPKGGISC